MKTKCMSCGGTTKKMQKGGSTDSTRTAPYVSPKGAFYPDKKSLESGCAKNPNSPECKKVIKTMSPAEAAKIKGRLLKGGSVDGPMEARRKIMGEKKPSLKRTLRYVKKNGSGLILKDKSKFPEGIYKPTMQTGGFPITAKAAARKVAKGKGMMTYKYGTTDAPGTGNNKGAYVKFAKDQESNPYGGKSLKGSRSRSVMQKGGVKK